MPLKNYAIQSIFTVYGNGIRHHDNVNDYICNLSMVQHYFQLLFTVQRNVSLCHYPPYFFGKHLHVTGGVL